MALVFALAAGVATVVPHRTGALLQLHLFLAGALLLAISGTTRLFVVTWSAGEPSHPRLVVAQRWLVAVGAGGLAAGRELDAPVALVAAVGFGIVGTVLGVAMVTGRAAVRDAHLVVNLLGLVGLVIATPGEPVSAGVHILTGHKGKGQEFDWVVVVGLEEGQVPAWQSKTADEIAEELRVLHVMASRARYGLAFTYTRHGGRCPTRPSRWLEVLRAAATRYDHAWLGGCRYSPSAGSPAATSPGSLLAATSAGG